MAKRGSTYVHKQTRHNETVFEKVRRIVINNGRKSPSKQHDVVSFCEHAQAYSEHTVENGADARREGEPKNNFT